jgi:hypothetical protein
VLSRKRLDFTDKTKKEEEKEKNDLKLFPLSAHRRSIKYLIILFVQSTTVTSVVQFSSIIYQFRKTFSILLLSIYKYYWIQQLMRSVRLL